MERDHLGRPLVHLAQVPEPKAARRDAKPSDRDGRAPAIALKSS